MARIKHIVYDIADIITILASLDVSEKDHLSWVIGVANECAVFEYHHVRRNRIPGDQYAVQLLYRLLIDTIPVTYRSGYYEVVSIVLEHDLLIIAFEERYRHAFLRST